jgi:hypothetical protein
MFWQVFDNPILVQDFHVAADLIPYPAW